jgi:hypothetical protein
MPPEARQGLRDPVERQLAIANDARWLAESILLRQMKV